MLIHGSPVSQSLLRDTDVATRFWYWRGASGGRYIHSVYPADCCPPLPGAVYIAVKRTGSLRTALVCGRFPPLWAAMPCLPGDEIHVHLLAAGEVEARAIEADLKAALANPAYIGDIAA